MAGGKHVRVVAALEGVRRHVDMDRRLLAERTGLVGLGHNWIDNPQANVVLAATVTGARRESGIIRLTEAHLRAVHQQLAEQPAAQVDVADACFGLDNKDIDLSQGPRVTELCELRLAPSTAFYLYGCHERDIESLRNGLPLEQYDDAPVRTHILTLATKQARACLRHERCELLEASLA